jgi:hypothetical protein
MKKLILGAALLGSALTVHAEAPGGPGCGWGNMLLQGQSGLAMHILAITTNGTSGNGTFGMTSGTNGCSTDGKLTYGGKSMIGMSAIMDEFVADAASGEGEALNAVAVSMGIERTDRAVFAQAVHSNFNTIFPSADVTAEQVMAAIIEVMKADARLAKYVA